jgi:hypothetical protein
MKDFQDEKTTEIKENDNRRSDLRHLQHKQRNSKYQPPTIKDFLLVIIVFAALTVLSWIVYHKLGWFH